MLSLIFNILVPLTIAFAYSIKGIIDSGMSQNKEALTQAVLVGLLLFSSMQHSTLYLFD